jgi:2-polyprenyl-3-methyl-5-hydroxy-6-metoxy-1,4-benzoquinol methylase
MEKIHVCPWWMGYLLLIPLRKLGQDPEKILSPYIKPGMNILDYGCAMGYFSLTLASLTGKNGTVYCVDIQEKMLRTLEKRAARAGLGSAIKTRMVGKDYDTKELQGKIDFIMLFAVVHEVPEKQKLFVDLFEMAKPGCRILFAEPKGHVTQRDFRSSLQLAANAGFEISDENPMPKGLCAILMKKVL